MAAVLAVLVLAGEIALFEGVFRLLYRWRFGKVYNFIPKIPFEKIYVEPHPYLPYVYKKGAYTPKPQKLLHPLHKGEFTVAQYQVNNLGYVDGPDGDRDVQIPKPEGVYRIACLGASTTGNYIIHNNKHYSYPGVLEEMLQEQLETDQVEVNNFGNGSNTSADLLIRFLLTVIDTKPDLVLVYFALNDAPMSLTPGFQSDFSHARRSLGETYQLYKIGSVIPEVPLAFYNYMVNRILPQDVRNSLGHAISKGTPNIEGEFQGFPTFRRNMEHLIHICKANHIPVALSSLCYFLYPDIQTQPWYVKCQEAVNQDNEILRDLARQHELILVDNARLVPEEEAYFMDHVHFTPDGMKLLAQNFANQIIPHIREKRGTDSSAS